jgi:hypothetical protein
MGIGILAFVLIPNHAPKVGRETGQEDEWTVEEDMS